MCIVLLSTSHPQYPLILINNRDEYLRRPTAPAEFWPPPHEHILGDRDLLRPVQGTWLAITRRGRIAVLTNFREEGQPAITPRSRGAMVKEFVTHSPCGDEPTETFLKQLFEEGEGVKGIGGFSLVCGQLKKDGEGLAVISNRTPDVKGVTWLGRHRGETHGLSNSYYGDRSWPKVVMGEKLLEESIRDSAEEGEGKNQFVERLFGVLSTDTLPRPKHGEVWEIYLRQLRHSIFIPVISGENGESEAADRLAAADDDEKVEILGEGATVKDPAMSGPYGTQRQTVILVDYHGRVTFVERSLYDERAQPIEHVKGDRWYEFNIEGWN